MEPAESVVRRSGWFVHPYFFVAAVIVSYAAGAFFVKRALLVERAAGSRHLTPILRIGV